MNSFVSASISVYVVSTHSPLSRCHSIETLSQISHFIQDYVVERIPPPSQGFFCSLPYSRIVLDRYGREVKGAPRPIMCVVIPVVDQTYMLTHPPASNQSPSRPGTLPAQSLTILNKSPTRTSCRRTVLLLLFPFDLLEPFSYLCAVRPP